MVRSTQFAHLELPQSGKNNSDISSPTDLATERVGTAQTPAIEPAALDARAQLALLAKKLKQPFERASARTDQAASPVEVVTAPAKRFISPLIKSFLAMAIVVLLVMSPSMRLLSTTSAEAVINARVITLQAPIAGQVASVSGQLRVGTEYRAGDNIVRVTNPRSDHSKLDEIARATDALVIEKTNLESRLENLTTRRAELEAHEVDFKRARVAQIESGIAETQANMASAAAKRQFSQLSLARAQKLGQSGFATTEKIDTAALDEAVNGDALDALNNHLKGLQIELEAARRGISISDSYNDRPHSEELAEDIKAQIEDVKAQLSENNSKIALAKTSIIQELDRHNDAAVATIVAPVQSRLWEVFTSPGETVRQDQVLIRLLDCGGAVVTASVSEAAYNSLRLGGKVEFKLRGEKSLHNGTIASLSGLAATPSNLAIKPSRLDREPYSATIDVPDLAVANSCDIGRTGVATFDSAGASGVASQFVAWLEQNFQ